MFSNSETIATLSIILLAVGILAWGYQRAQSYGNLGILAWLQSVVLIAPWLIFFGLFAAGIYINLIGILLLIVVSSGIYIYLGRRLRSAGQDTILREKAAQRLQDENKTAQAQNPDFTATSNQEDGFDAEFLPIPEEDLKMIQSIFGIDTFFATETIPYQEGAIFRGNLRADPDIAHKALSEKLHSKVEDKYRLFLVESPEGKPVVIVLPSSSEPQPATTAQKALAVVLLVATLATSLEAAGILLGFDLFTNLERIRETIPIAGGLWTVLIAHEIGHRWFAQKYDLRLSLPYFIPSWQIGSFGAITRFESLIPHRTALFDVALGGAAAGGIVSLLLLVMGLVLSQENSMFQIPTVFLQSSILVGSLAKVVLGDALQQSVIGIHPLLVIGWLGLVISALNLVPAGQLDGGRIVQAIYGRKTARRTTIASLVILGIVALANPANPIPLYWGIVILFLQRSLERPSLNELTEPDDARAALGLLALFLMLATLIPLSPGLAGRLGIGG
jgi:membrane-associated protease RseP (regulator of RpoE activity)